MITLDTLRHLTEPLHHHDYRVREQTARDVLAADPSGDATVTLLACSIAEPGADRAWASEALQSLVRHTLESAGKHAPFLDTVRRVAIPTLLALAKDDDPFLRLRALDILGAVGPSAGTDALQAILAGLSDPSDWVKQSACMAVKSWGPLAAPTVGLLIMLLHTAVDEYACTALGAIGPSAQLAVPALRERARRGDPSGRDHAKQALAAIVGDAKAAKKPAKAAPLAAGEGGIVIGAPRVVDLGGGWPQALALAPDGKTCVTAERKIVYRRSLADGATLTTFAHDEEVGRMSYSHDGQLLATICQDGATAVFRVEDGARVASWPAWSEGHSAAGSAPAFSPDGRLLAFAVSGAVRIWDHAGGAMRELACGHSPWAVTFSPDGGTLFAWMPGGAKRFEVVSGKEVATHAALGSRNMPSFLVEPSGRILLCAGGRKRGEALIEDAATGEHLLLLSGKLEIRMSFFLDHKGALIGIVSGKAVSLFRREDGELVGVATMPRASFLHAAFSADDAQLVATDYKGRLVLWSLG